MREGRNGIRRAPGGDLPPPQRSAWIETDTTFARHEANGKTWSDPSEDTSHFRDQSEHHAKADRVGTSRNTRANRAPECRIGPSLVGRVRARHGRVPGSGSVHRSTAGKHAPADWHRAQRPRTAAHFADLHPRARRAIPNKSSQILSTSYSRQEPSERNPAGRLCGTVWSDSQLLRRSVRRLGRGRQGRR